MTCPSTQRSKVQALLDEGLLGLICDLGELDHYWGQLLQDFPHHPASRRPGSSFPLSLYGRLMCINTF